MATRHCLLVIDDEPDVVSSIQDLLRFDYRVLGATRAAEGMKLAEREDIHIVMTDQRMPEMTGVEFLEKLRAIKPDVVRLLCTGYADLKAVIDAINQGNVFRYLAKPWDTDELLAVLGQAGQHYDVLAERKRLLAEVQKKNYQLLATNVQVQEQNQQLERVNVQLRQANELKEAFIKVASHELRTPLTIILGLTDLARQTNEATQPLRGWLDHIYGGGLRLSRLVDQMVKMLLAGRFERPLAKCDVSLQQLLRDAAEETGPFAQQRQQTLDVQLSDDLGNVSVEPDKLRDSVTHLLLNAIKFTPDGGTVRLAGRRLPDGCAEIRVSDTGIGIDASSLNRIFDPFFTGFDVSRHCSGVFEFNRRGLGLGLSLVKAFVEMHGGTVRAESESGKGSSFIITLPG